MPHVNLAASEAAFQELFNRVRDSLATSTSNSGSFGPFTASYSAGIRLEGGTIDLQDSPDEVRISELDVVIDPLTLGLGIDIPEICVGGFCIIPSPFGCILRAPRICIFSANPDINISLNLGGLITSEISGAFDIDVEYFNNPGHAGLTNHQAFYSGNQNEWQFYLDPIWLDFDLIDISDTVGNILDAAIDAAINNLLGWLPGWVRDVLSWLLGGIVDIIRAILDIVDDIDEWLSDLLGVSFGLFDFILTWIADEIADDHPIFTFEDPYPILGPSGSLIPVLIPIRNVDVNIESTELILSADIG
ncbi:MAG: hypothetical protein ACKV1O_00770 [Saprospiraceae bacterium]